MWKIVKWIDDYLEAVLCSLLLASMSVIIMLQIIGRTVGFNISWNEELARYMYIWLIYIGCAYAVKLRRHIKMEAILLTVQRRGQLAFTLISNILFLIFAAVVVYEALPIIYKMHYVRKQFSPAMRLPMSYAFASVLAGFSLVSIRLIQDSIRLVLQYRRGEEI
jgi:TRAP-type C4-dicarboxylate transport system permease small subunit